MMKWKAKLNIFDFDTCHMGTELEQNSPIIYSTRRAPTKLSKVSYRKIVINVINSFGAA